MLQKSSQKSVRKWVKIAKIGKYKHKCLKSGQQGSKRAKNWVKICNKIGPAWGIINLIEKWNVFIFVFLFRGSRHSVFLLYFVSEKKNVTFPTFFLSEFKISKKPSISLHDSLSLIFIILKYFRIKKKRLKLSKKSIKNVSLFSIYEKKTVPY